jgi:hypothetical protein
MIAKDVGDSDFGMKRIAKTDGKQTEEKSKPSQIHDGIRGGRRKGRNLWQEF